MNIYNSSKYNKILKYSDSIKNGLRNFPASIQVALTDYCFNKCYMCGHWKREKKDIIDIKILKNFIKFGKVNGLKTICFSGGDPFAFADINEIMKFCENLGLEYGFITAGYVPDHVDLDCLRNSNFIRISLDSITNYSKCRGGIDIDNVLKSIKRLDGNNIKIGFGITVHSLNFNDIENIFKFIITLNNVVEVRTWPVRGDFAKAIADSDFIKMIDKYNNIFIGKGIDTNIKDLPDHLLNGEIKPNFNRCMIGKLHVFIGANGDIYPCCMIAGDSKDHDFGIILGNIKNFDITDFNSKIEEIAKIGFKKMPVCCRDDCTSRLSTINKAIEDIIDSKCDFV